MVCAVCNTVCKVIKPCLGFTASNKHHVHFYIRNYGRQNERIPVLWSTEYYEGQNKLSIHWPVFCNSKDPCLLNEKLHVWAWRQHDPHTQLPVHELQNLSLSNVSYVQEWWSMDLEFLFFSTDNARSHRCYNYSLKIPSALKACCKLTQSNNPSTHTKGEIVCHCIFSSVE